MVSESSLTAENLRALAFQSAPRPLALERATALCLVECNEAFSARFGYSAAELSGRSWLELIVPEEREYAAAALEGKGSGGRASHTVMLLRRDGSHFRGTLECAPLAGAGFRVISLTDHGEGSTDALEAALAESARNKWRFELAMRGANDGLWDWDMLTDTVYYSPRWKSMLGYSDDELEPSFHTWERLVEPEGRKRALNLLAEIMAGRSNHFEVEFRMRHKAGHDVYILSRAFVARAEDGKPTRMVGTHVDITAGKLHEQSLSDSWDYARAILDSMSAELVVLDNGGLVRMVNKAWRRGSRWGEQGPEEPRAVPLIGLHYQDLCRHLGLPASSGGAAVCEGISGVLSGSSAGFDLELPRRVSGEDRWFQMRVTPLGEGGMGAVICQIDVTERKRSEDALRTSQERYRRVVENQTEIICHYLPDNRLNFVNEAFCRLFGKAPEDLLGVDWHDLVNASEWPHIEERLREMSTSNPVVVVENRVPAGNGESRWIQFVNQGLYDGQGHLSEVQVSGRDITERKRLEQALLRESNRYEVLLRNASDGIFIMDEGARLVGVSESTGTMLGYSHDELIGMHVSQWDADYDDSLLGFFQQCLDNPARQQFERRHRHKDGRILNVEISVMPVNLGGERLLFCSSRDISARKCAEAALVESETKFRRQTQHLEEVIWGTNIGTWEWNVQTGGAEFNERWASIAGYALAELQPVSITTWVKLAHPEDLKRSDKLLEKCFRRETEYYECEVRVRHKNGEWVWVLDRGRVVEWTEDGQPLRMCGTHQDITERKRAEEALMSKTRELRALLDTIPAPVFFKDREMRHVAVNQAFCEFVGLSDDCIIGQRNEELFSKEVAATYDAGDRMVLKDGKTILGEELEISDAWGRLGWYAIFKSPVYDEEGAIAGLVGLRVDITQRKQTEAERISTLERQRDTLIREVHHRIKNHLQGVIGLLRGHVTSNPETMAVIELAVAQVRAISQVYGLQSRAGGGVVTLLPFLTDMVNGRPARLPVDLIVPEDYPDHVLSREALVPLALVINELLTNGEKHILPSEQPLVQIKLESKLETAMLRVLSSPARLPERFDFSAGRGVGAGLDLVRGLLPEGARLSIRQVEDGVVAELEVSSPALMTREPEVSPSRTD